MNKIAPNTYVQTRSIGGSDAAAVMGVSRYKTPAQVYDAITGRTGPRPTEDDRGPTERGRAMEDLIIRLYERETGNITFRQDRTISQEHPFLHASPDALIRSVLPEHNGLLEIKAPGTHVIRSIKSEGIPAEYYIQMQHYLFVLGLMWGDFVALDYDRWEPVIIKVPRDEQKIAEIVDKCTAFWLDYVEKGIRPAADAHGALVKQIPTWPKGRPGAPKRRDDPAWLQAEHHLKMAAMDKQLADHTLEQAKEEIKALMGEDEEIIGSDLKIVWKESSKRTFDLKAFAEARQIPLEDLEPYYRRTATRPFNIYPAKETK